MTLLNIDAAGKPDPSDLQVRVPWKYVAAWALAAVLGANGLRSFVAPVSTAAADTEQAQQITRLREEVASLNQKVAVLIAIVERVEAQQTRERGRR